VSQETHITFEFDEHAGLYWPGETISGQYFVETPTPQELKAIELSVLWFTMGKGDEDLAVHYFQRETVDDQGLIDLIKPRRFATELPNSPLSYDGIIVKICWCVRVRVFLRRGRDVVAEQPFQFGFLPRPDILRVVPPEKTKEGRGGRNAEFGMRNGE
jgi:hypothetical protein